ncbi:unnamed protein product [Parnassius apollo]|uniref:(apollo) hypothetical protein n=1 Tax=Parnassius apollo TaxID=110799 RepID=A0A8S3W910_PARAO|nr:unnamed protein product [Parnassius apollo]
MQIPELRHCSCLWGALTVAVPGARNADAGAAPLQLLVVCTHRRSTRCAGCRCRSCGTAAACGVHSPSQYQVRGMQMPELRHCSCLWGALTVAVPGARDADAEAAALQLLVGCTHRRSTRCAGCRCRSCGTAAACGVHSPSQYQVREMQMPELWHCSCLWGALTVAVPGARDADAGAVALQLLVGCTHRRSIRCARCRCRSCGTAAACGVHSSSQYQMRGMQMPELWHCSCLWGALTVAVSGARDADAGAVALQLLVGCTHRRSIRCARCRCRSCGTAAACGVHSPLQYQVREMQMPELWHCSCLWGALTVAVPGARDEDAGAAALQLLVGCTHRRSTRCAVCRCRSCGNAAACGVHSPSQYQVREMQMPELWHCSCLWGALTVAVPGARDADAGAAALQLLVGCTHRRSTRCAGCRCRSCGTAAACGVHSPSQYQVRGMQMPELRHCSCLWGALTVAVPGARDADAGAAALQLLVGCTHRRSTRCARCRCRSCGTAAACGVHSPSQYQVREMQMPELWHCSCLWGALTVAVPGARDADAGAAALQLLVGCALVRR